MVFVKEVPTHQNLFTDTKTGNLKRSKKGVMINPYDEAPIKKALALKEKIGAKITAISMGPPHTMKMIEYLIALGFDKGVLITDPLFAGADTLITASILAQGVLCLGMPLFLFFGEQTSDGNTGQVPAQVAEFLNIGFFSKIKDFKKTEDSFCALQKLDQEERTFLIPPSTSVALSFLPLKKPLLLFPHAKNYHQVIKPCVLNHTQLQIENNENILSPTRVVKIFNPLLKPKNPHIVEYSKEAISFIASKIKKAVLF